MIYKKLKMFNKLKLMNMMIKYKKFINKTIKKIRIKIK